MLQSRADVRIQAIRSTDLNLFKLAFDDGDSNGGILGIKALIASNRDDRPRRDIALLLVEPRNPLLDLLEFSKSQFLIQEITDDRFYLLIIKNGVTRELELSNCDGGIRKGEIRGELRRFYGDIYGRLILRRGLGKGWPRWNEIALRGCLR